MTENKLPPDEDFTLEELEEAEELARLLDGGQNDQAGELNELADQAAMLASSSDASLRDSAFGAIRTEMLDLAGARVSTRSYSRRWWFFAIPSFATLALAYLFTSAGTESIPTNETTAYHDEGRTHLAEEATPAPVAAPQAPEAKELPGASMVSAEPSLFEAQSKRISARLSDGSRGRDEDFNRQMRSYRARLLARAEQIP